MLRCFYFPLGLHRDVPLAACDVRHSRYCIFALHVHVVFAKVSRKVLDGDAIQRRKVMLEKVCADFEAQLVAMNGEAEHVHLLITYPPKRSVSRLVKQPQRRFQSAA